jgi:hypothetical protein
VNITRGRAVRLVLAASLAPLLMAAESPGCDSQTRRASNTSRSSARTPSGVDMSVVTTAVSEANRQHASGKVKLALIEACLVESNCRNLRGGDRDSQGFLQQRPSQGWKQPRNVRYATRSFVTKAKRNEHRYSSAGRLAQAVQRSAFPRRYDQRERDARALLRKVDR